MPGAIPLPSLFLVAVPVAMWLASSALSAGERRARARRARDALGPPSRHVEEHVAGTRTVLEGRLEVQDGPCGRFEDGEPVAAATAEAWGLGAVSGDTRPHFEPGSEPFIARSARANELLLHTGSERVVLDGPLDVRVGSDEMDPDAPFESLASGVKERIARVAGEDALPGCGVKMPILARPVFRSVRSGALVRVSGVLRKRSDAESKGYRQRAGWVLSGDDEEPLAVAFADTPKYQGAIAALGRRVRRAERLGAALLGGLVLGLIALAGALRHRESHHAGTKPSAALAHATEEPARLGTDAECLALRKAHEAAVSTLSRCASDADCASQARGGAFFQLEGCYRFANPSVPASDALRLQTEWIRLGCAKTYELCPPPPPVMCAQDRCVERPPPPLPETWRREDIPGTLTLYLPPEMSRSAAISADSDLRLFEGGGARISIEYWQWSPHEQAELSPNSVADKIGGRDAQVRRLPREITVQFAGKKGCAPPACPDSEDGERLTVRALCDSDAACAEAWQAIESIRFW